MILCILSPVCPTVCLRPNPLHPKKERGYRSCERHPRQNRRPGYRAAESSRETSGTESPGVRRDGSYTATPTRESAHP